MMLIYVTVCDNAGRDASVLLDISRLVAVAPYAEPSPRPSFYSLGSDDSHRPRNRDYLEVWIGTNKWVVLASEWPRIKAALVRVNGGGFNRFGNDAEDLERPRVLTEAPSVGHASRPGEYPPPESEYADVVETRPETARGVSITTLRFTPHLATAGVDMGIAGCSPSS